jgi:hypothetical protein
LSAPSFEKRKSRFSDPSVEAKCGRVLHFRAPIGGDDAINRSPAKHRNIDILLLKWEITTIIVGNNEVDRRFKYVSMGGWKMRANFLANGGVEIGSNHRVQPEIEGGIFLIESAVTH